MLIHFIFLYPKFCFFFSHFTISLTVSHKSNEVSKFVHYFPYLFPFLMMAFFMGSPFLPCHLSSPAMASCHGSPSLIIVADTDAQPHCRYGYLHNTCRRLGSVNTSSQKGLGPMRLHSLPFLKHWQLMVAEGGSFLQWYSHWQAPHAPACLKTLAFF